MSRSLAVVGATGAVGREFESILRQRNWNIGTARLFGSQRSAGTEVDFLGRKLAVQRLSPESFEGIDIAFFSAGASVSREYAPMAVKTGAVVIDNSSAFRMTPDVPLVIPEVNPQAATRGCGIVAVPNCSAIILAVALWPLHVAARVRRAVIATYQAASGAGARGLAELEEQTRAVLEGRPVTPSVFPCQCAFNVFSHNSAVGPDGFNVEESKIVEETRKIFGEPELALTATCMRAPVMRAHTEAVAVEFERPLSPDEAREALAAAPGVRIVDDPRANRFPTPIEASGGDEVLVGRLRRDPTVPGGRGLQFICCGDQLRKGAALNAVQIAELLDRGTPRRG